MGRAMAYPLAAFMLSSMLVHFVPTPVLAMRRNDYGPPKEGANPNDPAGSSWVPTSSSRSLHHALFESLDSAINSTVAMLHPAGIAGRPFGSAFVLLERSAGRHVQSTLHVACADLQEHPDYAIVVLWFMIFSVSVSRIWLASGTDFEVQSKEARSRRDRLHGAYTSATAEIEGILANLSESAVSLAEWNFNEKRKVFARGLERVCSAPDKHFPNAKQETIDAFRNFVALWLRSFAECTEDPLRRPRWIVERQELDGCRRIQDIAKLVSGRVQRSPVDFLRQEAGGNSEVPHDSGQKTIEVREKHWLRFHWGLGCGRRARCSDLTVALKAREHDATESAISCPVSAETFPKEFDIACLQVTILSNSHLIALGTHLVGFPVLAMELALRNWFSVAFLIIAEAYLFYGLFKIRDYDEICILEEEIAHLERVSEEVTEHRSQLVGFYVNVRGVNTLWQYRTLPVLELLDAVFDLVVQERDPDFLRDAANASGRIVDGRLPELVLTCVAEELKAATDDLHEHSGPTLRASALERLKNTFGAAVVRVFGAKGLGGRGLQGLNKIMTAICPVVTVSVTDGQRQRHAERGSGRPDAAAASSPFRTERAKSSTDPRWEGEEFLVPIPWRAKHLQLHVWDAHPSGDPLSLGFYNLDLGLVSRGVWLRGCERLVSARNGDELNGEIDFEVFFADEVRQLVSEGAPALQDLKRISDGRF